MSETEKSGTPNEAPADFTAPATAPKEAAPASPVSPAPATPPAAFGSFGGARGSGLVRGKRPAPAAAATGAPAPSAGYKPTSLEVITSQTEYKNPFTGETSVSAPRTNEPAPPAVSESSDSAASHAPLIAIARSPVPESSASVDAVARSDAGVPSPLPTQPAFQPPARPSGDLPDSAGKPGLNILPPENAKRPALHWESTAPAAAAPADSPMPRPDERRTFQTSRERRDSATGRPFEQRQPRDPRDVPEPRDPRGARDARDQREPREQRSFEPREPRRDDRRNEPRPQSYQGGTPAPAPEPKAGGLMGWLKGIFGGPKKEEGPPPAPRAPDDVRRDGEQRQGGYRGGRGRGGQGGYRGENRGPREQGQPGQRGEGGPNPQGGEYRGDPRGEGDQGGQRRRRRRGGRGRFRGEGGDGPSDRGPRPEGQQGGGAI